MNSLERLDAADNLVSLVARCINLGHPDRDAMMDAEMVTVTRMLRLTDAQMIALTSRLEAWISTQLAAITAPVEAV